MKTTWSKAEDMSNDEKYNLHEYRITQLERNHEEMKQDLRDIKEVVYRMDKKLSGISESGLQCQIHSLKLSGFEERLLTVETKTETINKKIIMWSAVAAVVLFLLSQVAIPYALEHYKVAKNADVTIYDPSPAAYFHSLTNGVVRHQ